MYDDNPILVPPVFFFFKFWSPCKIAKTEFFSFLITHAGVFDKKKNKKMSERNLDNGCGSKLLQCQVSKQNNEVYLINLLRLQCDYNNYSL